MFFQVSPVRKFRPKSAKKTEENEEIPVVILAPFTKIPKLSFLNVPLNSSNDNLILVKNPGTDPVAVNITFEGPDNFDLSLNWNQEIIGGGTEKLLVISWNPKIDYSVRYFIKISSGKNSWNIPISFKTSDVSSLKKTPKITVQLARKKSPLLKNLSNHRKLSLSYNKENMDLSNGSNTPQIIPGNSWEPDDSLELKSVDSSTGKVEILEEIEEFDDSLESPRKTRQILSQIEEKTPILGKFLRAEKAISSVTPNCRNFHPKRVSSEKKEFTANQSHYIHASFDVRTTEKLENTVMNTPPTSRPENSENCEESGIGVLMDTTLENKRKTPIRFSPAHKRRVSSPETWSKMDSSQKLLKISKVTLMKNDTKTIENVFMVKDPFILAATISIDPFLTNTIHLDESWIMEQEIRFKRWFNKLLAPPIELEVTENGQNIDAAKIWAECLKRDVPAAPTKEAVCIKYHTKSKLDILRKTAGDFLRSEEIKQVLMKISKIITSGKIEIRPDRNIHLDLVLQKKIITLLLSYNPLWLRIALETIYNENLCLNSNSDIVGLSRFICERFFKDPNLLRKYRSAQNPKYTTEIKKFILKKFLYLVYFLDKAKKSTLIKHDPCLFRRNSTIKESREILIEFSKDAITGGIGDINRYLKYFNYIVDHKQFYIHEYDYAVTNLGTDLRDGVRLTRIMELILLRKDLTEKLRVPTISRLQKIHNVKLAFRSLEEAGFAIQYDIEAAHIVDGHREKTLSFLWQIIYKFQAPLLVKTVESIQKWWRSIPVCAKRLQLQKNRNLRSESAAKIQTWYKKQRDARKMLKFSALLKEQIERRKRERMELKKKNSILAIQRFFRAYLQMKNCRKSYAEIKKNAIIIQRKFKANKTKICYESIKKTAIFVQKTYRNKKFMQLQRQEFLNKKMCAIKIQRFFRAYLQMKNCRKSFVDLKKSAIIIQRRFRAYRIRIWYKSLKKTAISMQKMYRNKKLTQLQRQEFLNKKISCIKIQRYSRNCLLMKKEREYFLNLQKNVRFVQNKFRAKKSMEIHRKKYVDLRNASIYIQLKIRANKLMITQKIAFKTLKKAVIFVQSKFRAKKMMLKSKNDYETLRKNVILVQRKYRANKLMKIHRDLYLQRKNAVIILQNYFKAYLIMKEDNELFMKKRKSVVIIQNWYRSYTRMFIIKNYYESLKMMVVKTQQRFRANQVMKKSRLLFLKQKQSCVVIQRFYRNLLLMRAERAQFLRLKTAVKYVEIEYKARKSMEICRDNYQKLRTLTLFVQRKFRANKLMKIQRCEYVRQKMAAVKIQQFFLGFRQMKIDREHFLRIVTATKCVQKLTRGFLVRKKYGYLLTPEARDERRLRKLQEAAAIKIQAFWRGHRCRSQNGEKMRLIRRRSQIAEKNATNQNTLGSRCQSALEMLTSESITYSLITTALADLEYVTRRSMEICKAYGPILPEQMYIMIISSARSLPEVKMNELSILILLNFCKYPPTTAMTWFPKYLDGVIDTMMHWCDKEELVFPALCTLIWIFGQDEHYRETILNLPMFYYKMEKIRVSLLRKGKMVSNSKKLSFSRFQSYRSLPLPDLKPDWGFDYSNRPRTFTNSIHALECLIDIFNLS